jgi:hypothetical protein
MEIGILVGGARNRATLAANAVSDFKSCNVLNKINSVPQIPVKKTTNKQQAIVL